MPKLEIEGVFLAGINACQVEKNEGVSQGGTPYKNVKWRAEFVIARVWDEATETWQNVTENDIFVFGRFTIIKNDGTTAKNINDLADAIGWEYQNSMNPLADLNNLDCSTKMVQITVKKNDKGYINAEFIKPANAPVTKGGMPVTAPEVINSMDAEFGAILRSTPRAITPELKPQPSDGNLVI